MLRLFLSSAIQAKWGKWWSSGKSLKQRRHHPSLFQALKGVIGKQCKLYINHLLSVPFFLEKYAVLHHLVLVGFLLLKSLLNTYNTHSVLNLKKYADLHHPGVVCFWFWKICRLTAHSCCMFFYFEKYADLHHQVVVCSWFWKVCWLTSPSRCMFLILKSMLTYITQSLYVFDFEEYADLHHPGVVCFSFLFWKVCLHHPDSVCFWFQKVCWLTSPIHCLFFLF